MTYHPQKGCGYGHVTVLKFCCLLWCSTSHEFVSDSWATCFHSAGDPSHCHGTVYLWVRGQYLMGSKQKAIFGTILITLLCLTKHLTNKHVQNSSTYTWLLFKFWIISPFWLLFVFWFLQNLCIFIVYCYIMHIDVTIIQIEIAIFLRKIKCNRYRNFFGTVGHRMGFTPLRVWSCRVWRSLYLCESGYAKSSGVYIFNSEYWGEKI